METSKLISKRSSEDCKIYLLDHVREKALYLSDVPSLTKEEILSIYPKMDASNLPSNDNFKETITLPENYEDVDRRIKSFINFLRNCNQLDGKGGNNEIILRLLKGKFLRSI
ncbi:Histidine phosphatase [Cryptosporidium felis]|nr:Histidine phosphatase [Cryptosporidium felis]